MSRVRVIASLAVAVLALPLFVSPAAARSNRDELGFKPPVALFSASPTRDVASRVYNNGERGKHEWSGEPVIQVDSKGIVYIAGTCCVVASSPVWRSEDGKKFVEMESPGHFREWGVGAEGDLAVDDEGNVFFVDTYVPGMLFTHWSDHGKTWEYTGPTSTVPGMNDRPWIAYSNEIMYLYVNHVSHTTVYYSTDQGRTWSFHGPLAWKGEVAGQPYFPGHISSDRQTGTLWVGGLNVGEKGNVLGATVSKDGGQTFTEAVVHDPKKGNFFSPIFTGTVAVDDHGTGYVAWSEYNKKGCDVFYASSGNYGKSWSDPVRVSDGKGCATFPWITGGGAGKIGLAWYQTPEVMTPDLTQQFLGMLNGRSYYGAGVPIAPQDEVPPDANWYLHAAAVTGANTNSPDVAEARVPTKTPVAQGPLQRQLWDFLQLDIGPDGRLHITYAEKFKDIAPQTWYVTNASGPKLN